MMTDFRALCAELADAYLRTLEHINNSTWLGYEPSDDPLLQRARASLADEPAAPAPPADGEVAELVAEIRHFLAGYQQMRGLDPEHIYSIHRGDKMEAHITVSRLTRAAELLQRHVVVPVAVSERLPEAGDCDAEGRCWWRSHAVGGPYWHLWHRQRWTPIDTHWLPAHALPLPEVGE